MEVKEKIVSAVSILKRSRTEQHMRSISKPTLFDALNLLVVDRSNRDTAAKDIPHMLPTNVFCLLHNVAVVAGRADVHGRFGTREDAGTNGKTAGEI